MCFVMEARIVKMSFDEILLESKTITRKGEWNYANSGTI